MSKKTNIRTFPSKNKTPSKKFEKRMMFEMKKILAYIITQIDFLCLSFKFILDTKFQIFIMYMCNNNKNSLILSHYFGIDA